MSLFLSTRSLTIQKFTQGALLLVGGLLCASFLSVAPSFASTVQDSIHTSLPVDIHLEEIVWTEVFEASEPFNLLSFTGAEGWEGSMEIRFEHAGEWGAWVPLELDLHRRFDNEYEAIVTDLTTRFQVQLTTPSSALPFQWQGNFELIGGRETPESSEKISLNKIDAQGLQIISRSEWGADETLRYIAPEDFVDYPINDSLLEENLKIMNVEYKDEAGNTLNWPLQYSTSVTRLTVHHTTTDLKHLKDPAGAVRSIYYFHTVTRGWGDLGYHYLIAPDGTIYKGRYGEDNVVAAHASGYNVGNVGIVLIGPYHREPVEGAAFDSLLKLLLAKAEEHEIDIDATSPYKGVEVDNLIGHQDVGGTLCPGIHMYEHLDELRAILGAEQDMKTSANYTVGTDLIVLDPQEAQRVEISIQNLSDTSWNGKTYFEVEAVTDARFLAQYPQETLSFSQSVAPGANGKLAWPLKSDWDAGLTAFKITPYWNGLVQDEAFLVPVFVQEPFVNFEVLDLTYPQVASEGTSFTVRAEIKNVGNFTWNHPAHPESSIQIAGVDAAQVGLDDPYLSVATLATITQTVEVGETVMVEWEVDAGQLTQGQQFFHAEMPEVESSISSRLHHLTVWTNPESQEISIVNKGEARVFQVGKAIGGWIQFTNHTDQSLDLTQNDLHWVGTVHSEGGLMATDLETSFALKVLEPGMSTRLYFRLTAPDETGEYQIDWMPMQGGFEIWTTPLIYDFAIENG